MKTIRAVPELRHLFFAAKRYQQGKLSICELNGIVAQMKALAWFGRVDPSIYNLLIDWEKMVNRRWNEWHLEKDPLTEAQFCDWLSRQLVFDF